jgi:hypothetical protein
MSEFEDLLSSIKDRAISEGKVQLLDFYDKAKDEQYTFVQETVEKTKKWLGIRLKNELTNEEMLTLLQ